MVDIRSRLSAEERLLGPVHQERHVRVVCIGAGASGLMLGYKLKKHFSNFSLTIYEKNGEVSGTWFENKYPGCACDIPAHNYTYSFEPKPDWSAVYASSKEIHDYFLTFAKKYGIDEFVKTKHQVTRAQWEEEQGGYRLEIKDLSAAGETIEDVCDILINASGILNNWRWPNIPGLQDFKGTLLHTACWDTMVELKNKRVGIIGNGSSGIQVFPAIQPEVQHCTLFIRTPTWVSPVQGVGQHVFSSEEKERFANEPGRLLQYRKKVERAVSGTFSLFVKNSKANQEAEASMRAQMEAKLSNELLASKLIPTFSVGCRRFTPGISYIESLSKPNVSVVLGGVSQITEKGCIASDASEIKLDVLVCATGFDTSFKPRLPIINGNGKNLQDEWATDPESYLGIAAAGYPNYFMFLGPNCPIGNGPVLPAIESQADYICRMIDRYQTHNIHSFAPTREAVSDFVAHKDQYMKGMVWSDSCRSWYKANPRKPDTITALWPGSSLHYAEVLASPRMEDFDVKYQGNRFAWLGNGFSQCESDPTADWSWYIREEDDGEPLSLGARIKIITKHGTATDDDGFDFMGTNADAQAKI